MPSTMALDSMELPKIDMEGPQGMSEQALMGTSWPGGDVMHQSLWRKFGPDLHFWSPEEKAYKGARVGEYARPLIMEANKLGYPNKAIVPFGASEDILGLVAQAGVAARRSRHAAVYASAQLQRAGPPAEHVRVPHAGPLPGAAGQAR